MLGRPMGRPIIPVLPSSPGSILAPTIFRGQRCFSFCKKPAKVVNIPFVPRGANLFRHPGIPEVHWQRNGMPCFVEFSRRTSNALQGSDIFLEERAAGTRITARVELTDSHGSRSAIETPGLQWVTGFAKRTLIMLLVVTCTAVVVRCGAAYATENIMVTNLQLPGKVRALLGLLWTKGLQVWSVFKDHGLLLVALLGLSAFFSMAETSITTLWPWKVRELAERESEDGVFQMLRQDVTRFLTTILIGTTVANIAATALVTDAATALFGEAGVSAATGVMTVVVLLLTEITPKSIAVHNATDVARFVVRPVAWLSLILYPVGRVVTALSMGMLKILGLKSQSEPVVTEEELKLMLRGAELSGAIEEEEQVCAVFSDAH